MTRNEELLAQDDMLWTAEGRKRVLALMDKAVAAAAAKPVMLCGCGAVLETPSKYAEHCAEFPTHFTKS